MANNQEITIMQSTHARDVSSSLVCRGARTQTRPNCQGFSTLYQWQRVNRTIYFAAIVAIAFFVFAPIAQAQTRALEPEATRGKISALFDQLRLSMARMHSVQYKYVYKVGRPHISQGPKLLQQEIEYKQTGNMFLSRVKSRVDDQDIESIVSYDGDLYQELDEAKTLNLNKRFNPSTKVSARAIQPIVAPMLFAIESPPYDYNMLLNKMAWDKIASMATLGDEQDVDGRKCAVLAFDRTRNNLQSHYDVFLDMSRNYYPIRVVMRTDSIDSLVDTRIVKAEEFQDAGGKFVVPIDVSITTTRPKSTPDTVFMVENYSVDPGSLKVNEAIEKRSFTIDKSVASGGIYNNETRRWIVEPDNRNRETQTVETPKKTSGALRTLVWINVVIAVCVCAVVFRNAIVRYIRGSRSQ